MSDFGFNAGFVDELYARFLEDPSSVSESWREFFADYHPHGGAAVAQPASAVVPLASAPSTPSAAPPNDVVAGTSGAEAAEPLRGIAAKIAENMEQSLAVPTATTVRTMAVKLLEENRKLINRHQQIVSGAKVSFTHMLAWAIARALEKHPGMNSSFSAVDGKPGRVTRATTNLGIAIDVERKGERILLVPNIKDAGRLNFPAFVGAYDDLIARARANKLAVDEFQSTTVSITNPGMLGTSMSVPRLMDGQGTILGIGSIGFPPEYAGVSPQVISELGLSRVMTVTSTYDHRVIQGAESGAFLATLEKLVLGNDGFYERIFRELAIPHEPVSWAADQNPQLARGGGDLDSIRKQAAVLIFIRAHRVRGHLYAHIDPLATERPPLHHELELSHYGLSVWDLEREFMSGGLAGSDAPMPLRDIVDILRETYCRHIGAEYMHLPFPEQRAWLQARMESTRNAEPFARDQQKRILKKLNAAEAFERFLHTTYVGQKRFSLEGAETLIPMLDFLLGDAADAGVSEAIIGMAHRGRLNVLCNTVGKAYDAVFREFEGYGDPNQTMGSGDVKYHLGSEGVHKTEQGNQLKISLACNPSHLEAVDPVVEGMARARQDILGDNKRAKVLPVLIHGDAAFAGQGVVAETLGMSQLSGYRTGGTVHIVVNNQIGFTTGPKDARSSLYATDVAKMVHAPIFHVNGDHPEDAVRIMRLAFAFRQQFERDVVVDVVCYRRWGHNEGDDPSYTQPLTYTRLEKHRSVRKLYTEQLLRRGDMDPETAEKALNHFHGELQRIHDAVRAAGSPEDKPRVPHDRETVEGVGLAHAEATETAASRELLEQVLVGLERYPDGFAPHPKLIKQLEKRRERFDTQKIDWGLGEALAFGSLVVEGHPVRLSGEDCGRGTFSHRHATLHDFKDGKTFVPLAHLTPTQAPFQVYDSLLSEFGVMGFEYGYSVTNPKTLVMWEAQFGDFANGAQVIIDQFIASGEDKWGQTASLVLMLPHGFEGQGPEHSSARIERYLQLCAVGNIRVCYPTTPAQLFHVMRRQAISPEKKPLVLFTPKSLLRHPDAVSPAEAFTHGRFQPVLGDPKRAPPDEIRRVVLSSGKIYYDLAAYRAEKGIKDVALLRVEQYYPYPGRQLAAALEPYEHVRDIVWAQEEPRNMGAWDFLAERVETTLEPGQSLRYIGRPPAASPATGSYKRHTAEQHAIVSEALEGEGTQAEVRPAMDPRTKNKAARRVAAS